MRRAPTERAPSRPKKAGLNSQRVIDHGISPASTHGATIKNSAEPKTALTLCMVPPDAFAGGAEIAALTIIKRLRTASIRHKVLLSSPNVAMGHSQPNPAVRAM